MKRLEELEDTVPCPRCGKPLERVVNRPIIVEFQWWCDNCDEYFSNEELEEK